MEEQPQLSGHPAKGISLISLSYLLERFSYYGVRSIIVLYFVTELHFKKSEAAEWYGLFLLGTCISALIGALLGDFLIGAPMAMIAGGILEATGCFCLTSPGENTAIAGMILIALGGGLFRPNAIQQTASFYKNRVRYMDAGFSIVYFAINVGAFLGPIIISEVIGNGFAIHYSTGFFLAGVAALISVVPVIFDYGNFKNNFLLKNESRPATSPSAIIALITALLLTPIFWSIYEVIANLANSSLSVGDYMRTIIPTIFVIILSGPIAGVLWSFVKLDSIYKISFGFFFLVLPLLVVLFISPIFKGATLLTGISETLVAISSFSIIARFAPPKLMGLFFAIGTGLSYFSARLASYIDQLITESHGTFVILLVGFSVAVSGLFFVLARTLPQEERIN
jgi:MFS family permease